MSISTKKREVNEKLVVGYSEFKVIALNPERDELNELLGTEKTDELEYLSEDDEGNAKIRLTFWLEDVRSKWKQSVSFWLVNKERANEAGDSNQWVNQSGKCSWADDKENLPTWFKNFMKKETPVGEQYFRIALDGEENLVNFLNAWLLVDRKEGTGILPDVKKFFKGNVKELRDLINSDLVGNVIVSLGIKTREIEIVGEDGQPTGNKEKRDYQSVFNKAFLPGSLMKNLRIGGGNEFVKKQIAGFEKAHIGQYGFKDFYIFQEAKPYNIEDNVVHDEDVDRDESDNKYN